MKNTNTIIAELQTGDSLTITHKKSVGLYSCVGEPIKSKGKQNMHAFSVFKHFSVIESYEFFSLVENRNKLTNKAQALHTENYTESEFKRFRIAIKSLIEKDCIRTVSKKDRLYMINPRLILGAFDAMDELIAEYESLSKE